MWVILKKYYAGPLGFFNAGTKYDLPAKTVNQLHRQLGDENVIETCSPYDEKLDKKTAKQAELIAAAETAIKKVQSLKTKLVEINKQQYQNNHLKKQLEKELGDAVAKARQLAKKAGLALDKEDI